MVSVWSQEARKCTRVLEWSPREVPALCVGFGVAVLVLDGWLEGAASAKTLKQGSLTSVTDRKKSPRLQHIVGGD